MSAQAADKTRAFMNKVQDKIQQLLTDFSEGKLNKDQFHAVYEHYNAQLALAIQALQMGNPDAITLAQSGTPTIAIKEEFMGKAIGLMIYNNRSGTLVETLGEFDIPIAKIAPILNDFSLLMQSRKKATRRIERMGEKRWLLFAAGVYTTVVTLFHNEPSQLQSQEMERLHHDFEEANHFFFESGEYDSAKLAYPFLVFIKRKLSR